MSDTVPKIIGICGGSASGKTSLATCMADRLGRSRTLILSMDNFYIDFVKKGLKPEEVNYDHPESFDMLLLADVLSELLKGRNADVPVYDFKTHSRQIERDQVHSSPYIILEGLFLFNITILDPFFSCRIYVDTPVDVRLSRRIHRDAEERGRSPESVRKQFSETVSPMHHRFVRPNKELASLVLKGDEDFVSQLSDLHEYL